MNGGSYFTLVGKKSNEFVQRIVGKIKLIGEKLYININSV